MTMLRTCVLPFAIVVGTVGALRHIPLVPHHVQTSRRSLLSSGLRRRQHRGLQRQVGALYQGYGTHYVDMWTGTPPQRQTVIVDTGSGVTAFPCSGCADCGKEHHTDSYFIEADSSTFHKVGCDECKKGRCGRDKSAGCKLGMNYKEPSSWSAYEARDMCYIGGPHTISLDQGSERKKHRNDIDPTHANRFAFEATFGCQTELTGLFKTQLADGIMGMDNAKTSFWVQAHDAGVIKKKNFSLCYARQPTASRQGTESGAMTLGGFDRRLHYDSQNGVVYTPMANGGSGFFSVHLRKIYLREGGGGDSLYPNKSNLKVVPLTVSESALNQGSVIVDSGTTDTYFTHKIDKAFRAAWNMFSPTPYSNKPVSLTEEELDDLPTILLQIEGDMKMNGKLGGDPNSIVGLAGDLDPDHPLDVVVAIPPSHYMEWDAKAQKYVARFYTNEPDGSVLGGNTMMGHDVNFDVENGRIGWAESDCDYTKLINDNGLVFTLDEDVENVAVKKEEEKEAIEGDDDDDYSQGEEQVEEVIKKKPEKGKSTFDALKASVTVVKSCTGLKCQMSAVGVIVGSLLVLLFIVRRVRNRRDSVRYHPAELEVSNNNFHDDDELDAEEFVGYRDNPVSYDDDLEEYEDDEVESDENDVADEGVGYEDEPVSRGIA